MGSPWRMRPTHLYIKRVVALKSPHKLDGLIRRLAISHLGKNCAIYGMVSTPLGGWNGQDERGECCERSESSRIRRPRHGRGYPRQTRDIYTPSSWTTLSVRQCDSLKSTEAIDPFWSVTVQQVAHATSFFVHLTKCDLWRSYPHVCRLLSIAMSPHSGEDINQRLILDALKACRIVVSGMSKRFVEMRELIRRYVENVVERVHSPCVDFAEVLCDLGVKNERFTDMLTRELRETAVYMDDSRLLGALGYLLHDDHDGYSCHPREPIHDILNILSECTNLSVLIKVVKLLKRYKMDHAGFVEHLLNMCIGDGSGSPMDHLDTLDVCTIFDALNVLEYDVRDLANVFFSRYAHRSSGATNGHLGDHGRMDGGCGLFRSTRKCGPADLVTLLDALQNVDMTIMENVERWRSTLVTAFTEQLKRMVRHGRMMNVSTFTRLFSIMTRMEPKNIPHDEAKFWMSTLLDGMVSMENVHSIETLIAILNGYLNGMNECERNESSRMTSSVTRGEEIMHSIENIMETPRDPPGIMRCLYLACTLASRLPRHLSYTWQNRMGAENRGTILAARDCKERFVYDTSVKSNYKLMKKSGGLPKDSYSPPRHSSRQNDLHGLPQRSSLVRLNNESLRTPFIHASHSGRNFRPPSFILTPFGYIQSDGHDARPPGELPNLEKCLYLLRSLYKTLHMYALLHGLQGMPLRVLIAIRDFLDVYHSSIDILDSNFEAEYTLQPVKRQYSKIRLNWDHFMDDYEEALRIVSEPKDRSSSVMPKRGPYRQSLHLFKDVMGSYPLKGSTRRKSPKSSDMHSQVSSTLKVCLDGDLHSEELAGPYFIDIVKHVSTCKG